MNPSQIASIVFFSLQTIVWASKHSHQNAPREESKVKEFSGFQVTILENRHRDTSLTPKEIRNKKSSRINDTSRNKKALVEKRMKGKALVPSPNKSNLSCVDRMVITGLTVVVIGGVCYYLLPNETVAFAKWLAEPWTWVAKNGISCANSLWKLGVQKVPEVKFTPPDALVLRS